MIDATPSVVTAEARAAIVHSLVQEHQAGVRAFIRASGSTRRGWMTWHRRRFSLPIAS